ncbi:MAG: glycine zipper family protein [Magnetococcales bacterium]|nr:glycine zipper family protein [Magnetococcales bacterium]NGZ29291.1 glycine zipper family protein [Magnetococcales bacterium]
MQVTKKAIIPPLCLLLLAGCVTQQGGHQNAGYGAPQQDNSSTLGTTGMAALGGAALGAMISKDKTKGALIGGLVGAAAGYAASNYFSQMQDQRVPQGASLNDQLRQTADYRSATERYKGEVYNDLDAFSREKRDLSRSRSRSSDLNDLRYRIEQKRQEVQNSHYNLKNEYNAKWEVFNQAQRNSNDSQQLRSFDDELRNWRRAIDQIGSSDRDFEQQLRGFSGSGSY